ncbi:MAG TPA: class I SAM-dependent methyltransferase [Candidatus Eisenbacteria bacterium]|nr:class I SAM-dependent methyltransferase [Candidatus Eisenbacteria bacterium]
MEAKTMDAYDKIKDQQRKGWAHFIPLEVFTTPSAAKLMRHAGVKSGQRVLDVACGTGVVAITCALQGAKVTGLDLTPELIEHARENAAISNVDVEWHVGDVEELPFEKDTFDVVTSQFGHMFAPRPEVAIGQMLRVLKPGGTIAFATWPPELLLGRVFAMTARYLPPPPVEIPPPVMWGDVNVVRQRLGSAVRDIRFDRGTMWVPSLSVQHNRVHMEKTAGPVIRMVEVLSETDPKKLEEFRREYEALMTEYRSENLIRQDYLLTRAIKA